jgi:hypothetical protein
MKPIKALHSLHSKQLNMPNNFEDLQAIYISALICTYSITYARYYDHKILEFRKLIMKDPSFSSKILNCFFVTKFQNHSSKYDHGLI